MRRSSYRGMINIHWQIGSIRSERETCARDFAGWNFDSVGIYFVACNSSDWVTRDGSADIFQLIGKPAV